MIILQEYQKMTIGVLGLAKTGMAVINALLPAKANIIAWDDNPQKISQLEADSRYSQLLKNPADQIWQTISFLVASPGIISSGANAHQLIILANKLGIKVICDIELLYQHAQQAQYVGITGTNGKSTTTSLIAHILKSNGKNIQVGGNLGIPTLELEKLGNGGTYILELSSYQLDLLDQTHFNVRVLLNITPDHLDHHGSMKNYIKAKTNIFQHTQKNDLNIVGIDTVESHKIYQSLRKSANCLTIPISTENIIDQGVSVIAGVIYYNVHEEIREFYLGPLPTLSGKHNGENIACAFACAMHYGLAPLDIIHAIKTFPGLAHRLEFVTKCKNITYINDSKATNQEAAAKALASFDNIYWLVGGEPKEGGIKDLVPYFSKIKHAFLMGAAQEEFATFLAKHQVAYSKCNTLENCINEANLMALEDQAASVILLSPACASLDQWRNFEERGEYFIKYVKKLCQIHL